MILSWVSDTNGSIWSISFFCHVATATPFSFTITSICPKCNLQPTQMKGECSVEAYRVGILFLLLSLSAAGLDAKYLCRFTVLSSSAVPIDSSPVSPLSSSNITCSTPAFPVGPPSLSFNRTSSLWLVSAGKPIAAIPFYGASSINTVDPALIRKRMAMRLTWTVVVVYVLHVA